MNIWGVQLSANYGRQVQAPSIITMVMQTMSAEILTFNFLDPILQIIYGEATQDHLIYIHKLLCSYPPINYHDRQQLTIPKMNIVFSTIQPRSLPSV